MRAREGLRTSRRQAKKEIFLNFQPMEVTVEKRSFHSFFMFLVLQDCSVFVGFSALLSWSTIFFQSTDSSFRKTEGLISILQLRKTITLVSERRGVRGTAIGGDLEVDPRRRAGLGPQQQF